MGNKNLLAVSFSLTESTAQMHEFFMQTSMALAIMEGPEHIFSQANPQYKNLVVRNVVGKKVSEIFTGEELGPYLNLVGGVFKTGIPWSAKEQPFNIPNAKGFMQELKLDIAYYPMRDPKGIITGVLAVINDVTEQCMAKKIFNENYNATPHIYWSARADGFVDWYDDKFYSYTGMTRGALWNESGTPLHADDLEPITRLWTEAITSGNAFEINLRLKSKSDDKYYWFLSRAVAIKSEQGDIIRWVGTLTDVHENRLLLSQLRIEREMRERFIATLSHDLRSPMTIARMCADLLTRKHDDPDFIEKYSRKIIKSIDRADQMIRDLLDANRISSGEKLPLALEDCDLCLIALGVVEELRLIHGDRFKLNSPKELRGLWSKNGLRRILENLLNNGIKYGDEKSAVTLSLSNIDQLVLIEVHNWGRPILQADLPTLFDQYKRSAEAHHGHARVSSSLEFGTTFTVTLPE